MKIWLVLGLIGLASARAKGRAKEERLCQIPLVGKPDLRCDGEFRSWAFNTTSYQCERFVLTGCNIIPYTNSLYDSKHDCMSHCDKSNPLLQVEAPPTDLCYYPPTRGIIQCMAYMPRWSFDVSAAKGPSCVKYIYGGCAGTENLFSNEKDCLAACGDAITKIKAQCPAREKITSCGKYCSGDRDCDGGNVCCPSHDDKCGPQCVPVATQQSSNGSLVTAEERTSLSLKTRATCEQLVEQGPCFAAIRKFAFKPEKNRCEVFIYGGCQGNDNNFDSASECQKTCGGDFANDDLACASVQCDTDSTRQYKDRNCIPQYTKGACCPTSYHCEDHAQLSLGEPEEQVCLYKGQSYKVGANISAATEDDPCFTCHCSPGPTPSPPFISCSMQPCPLLQDPPSTNCLLATVPGQCCSEWKCERASLVTCEANNQTYQEGDTFHITPCRKCICTANYTDQNGYGCSDEVCIQQPPSPDCVPIYETGVCCPVDFHCPTNETLALNSTTQPNTDRVSFRPSFNESDCLLPSRVGRCKASFLRYYYDPATQKCKSFYYGGCSGNANRFETQWECEKACAGMAHEKPDKDLSPRTVANDVQTLDVCQQPKDVGPCRGYVPSFYYDSAKGKCERFFFGGCKGNGNRFDTVQECQKQCIKSSGRSGPSAEICKLPMVEGPCRAELRRFFFNATSQQCQYFNYGGCKGNENKFLTLALCEEQCKPNLAVETTTSADPLKPHVNLRSNSEGSSTKAPTPTSPSVPDFCSLPADVGPCKGHRSRYFHDSLTGQCRQFTYGGCKGNHNNFATQEECEATCRPAAPTVEPRRNNSLMPALGREQCKLPKDTGPCRMAVPRFYYNSQTSKCEPFTYGGCDGNANNYLTAEECQVRCGKGISRKEFDEIMGHRRPDQEQNPHTSARPKDTLRSTPKSHCALPADPGFCLAFMPRYYYNSETEKCERFIYGGCRGNANNFRTEEECLDSCGSQSSRKVSLPEESVCRFGNITLNRGDQLPVKDKCLDCICVTPPGLTCTRKACAIQPRKPFIPNVPDMRSSVDHDSDEKDEPKNDSGENQDQEQVEAKQNSSEETRGDDD